MNDDYTDTGLTVGGGFRLFASDALVKMKVTRVPGGYLHRWSIRRVGYVPDPQAYFYPEKGVIIMHPHFVDLLRRQQAEKKRTEAAT